MTDHTISRRRILKVSGAALAVGTAGCTTTSESGGGSTPTETDQHDDGGHTETSHAENSQTDSGHDDGGGHSHGEAVGEPVDHATVTMVTNDSGYHFEPHVVRVKPGGTVTWELESGSHTTTAYHPENDRPLRIPEDATPWDSGTMSEAGATFEHTFETEGVYDYYCLPHEATGMLGSVIVGEPDAHGQAGLAPPQDSLPEEGQTKITELNSMVNEALGHTHGEQTATESGGHHGETTTESGHHEEDGHHEQTTETGDNHDG